MRKPLALSTPGCRTGWEPVLQSGYVVHGAVLNVDGGGFQVELRSNLWYKISRNNLKGTLPIMTFSVCSVRLNLFLHAGKMDLRWFHGFLQSLIVA
jgi:hypothetical protein